MGLSSIDKPDYRQFRSLQPSLSSLLSIPGGSIGGGLAARLLPAIGRIAELMRRQHIVARIAARTVSGDRRLQQGASAESRRGPGPPAAPGTRGDRRVARSRRLRLQRRPSARRGNRRGSDPDSLEGARWPVDDRRGKSPEQDGAGGPRRRGRRGGRGRRNQLTDGCLCRSVGDKSEVISQRRTI